jgi:hypothetical protein
MTAKDIMAPAARATAVPTSKSGLVHQEVTGVGTWLGARYGRWRGNSVHQRSRSYQGDSLYGQAEGRRPVKKLLLLMFITPLCFGQATRWGWTATTTGNPTQATSAPGGSIVPVLAIHVPGTATGRTSTTPLQSFTMTDASALATDGTLAGDVHLTPYLRSAIVMNTPNDDAAYEAVQCNYTGSGPTGNCIPHFFIASNVPGDTHTGIWGGNAIVTEQVNTPSFGWEVNTFNEIANGDILGNGSFTAGPFWGISATAGFGTGQFTQQAAFLVTNDFLGGTGGGWDYGLYITNANYAAILCGTPSMAAVPVCISHQALGTATSTANFPSVPDTDIVTTWTGSINGNHTVTTQSVPGAGTNATFCKDFSFDSLLPFQICSNGSTSSFVNSNAPLTVHAASGGSSVTIGQTFTDTAHPMQVIVSGGTSTPSIQAITRGSANLPLALNPSGGAVSIGGGVNISSSTLLPEVGTPTVGQAACIKAAGPPVVIGYCSTAVNASGACTCN